MAMDTTVKKRSEQAAADCWSIEDLFPSDQAWEEAFAADRKSTRLNSSHL